MAKNPIIKVENVTHTVDIGADSLTILKGINLEIKTSESVAIVGTSGSGKSTLLGLMAGLDVASSGDIYLSGHSLSTLDEEHRAHLRSQYVGFIFQSFHLLPSLKAIENVMLPIELKGVGNPHQQAQNLLERVGLSHRLNHYPHQLSGGEQQRVAIARAFASEPTVLFADEPTGNLDQKTGALITEQLFALNQHSATTLVMVTHDKALAKRCDRQITIANGQIEVV